MKQHYSTFFAFIISLTFFFESCDRCENHLNYREQTGFNLEIRDANTQEHLFFGTNPMFSQNEFELFAEKGDSLATYNWAVLESENCFSISTNTTFSPNFSFDKLTDTFYVQISNYPLDTLTIEYHRETTECFENLVTNYDVKQNGILICESCNLKNRVTIFK